MNPRISIIIPVYNMEKSINDSVMSVLGQGYDNFEVILVDDGSKDNSLSECIQLEKLDERVKVYHTENAGSGPARNYGISMASGEYVYFMDADDLLQHDALEKMASTINNYYPDLLVFGFKKASSEKTIIGEKTYKEEIVYGSKIRMDYSDFYDMSGSHTIQGAPWNKLFKLEIIKTNKIEYPPLRRHQDDAFIGRYMCFANKIVFVSEVLYTHYLNDLKTEWKKYPVNYIDSVIGLYECRKETILQWNPEDIKTRKIVEAEYICNTIKGLEISFSPKAEFDKNQRYNWIVNAVSKSKIDEIDDPINIGKYQRIVFGLIKRKEFNLVMSLLSLKVNLEKIGILYWLKKIR